MDKDLKKLIAAARGDIRADLVLKNARVVNVFTKEIEEGDVAISDGYIAGIGQYQGDKEIDLQGKIVCPGFIDGHIHIESSMISPVEFAKAVVPHGTTAVITDPHEIANVAGTDGISFMIDSSRDLPVDIFFMLPSCVPATPLDESGAILNADALAPFYKEERVLGLAELMNSFGTVNGDDDIIAKIRGAMDNGKTIDGHAPFLLGNKLNAYVAAGVKSDHECSTAEEAIEKLKRGQWIMIRQGTAARNLNALLPLFEDKYCDRCLLVTDDKHPGELISQGHIDHIVREAIKAGKDPLNAIKMASFNAATYFGLKDRGAVAPGYRADLIVVSDLKDLKVEKVFKSGVLTAEDGELRAEIKDADIDKARYDRVFHSFNLKEVTPEDLVIKETGTKKRLIKVVPGEILTDEVIVDSSSPEAEPDKDICKIAVIERHHDTGHIGLGFITGYGLQKGAIASSVAHDSHNLIVVGTNDEDMALAANAVRDNEGGLAVVCDGKVMSTLALPLGGLMCEKDAAYVEGILDEMKKQARELGVAEGIDPFMTLAFTALPVIPKLRIITKGVVDVNTQSYAPVLFD
ncbi:Adenine deaminase [Ruminococcaceae bacterium KH2T8]|nr:Adenine deaminase [Ruminococcaceae bacterium KH2T8]